MRIVFLGQNGLLFESDRIKVLIDPYLSDSVGIRIPGNRRRVPVDPSFWTIRPDVLIFTHNHLDHYDPDTVPHFLSDGTHVTVLAPESVWEDVRHYGGDNRYVLFNRHTSWTEGGIRFTAVKAEHSDRTPIGVILDDGTHAYYVTGDTLYNEEIFADLPSDLFAVFLPVNGVGNNMNMEDAARFSGRVGAKYTVPVHFGLYDDLDPRELPCGNKVIPEIYREIKLG